MGCGILPLVTVVESLQLVLDLLVGVQLWVWSVVGVQVTLLKVDAWSSVLIAVDDL